MLGRYLLNCVRDGNDKFMFASRTLAFNFNVQFQQLLKRPTTSGTLNVVSLIHWQLPVDLVFADKHDASHIENYT